MNSCLYKDILLSLLVTLEWKKYSFTSTTGARYGGGHQDTEMKNRSLTFIINSKVLKTINIIMKYSNGVDTTILQILYLKLFLLFGIYLSKGRACIVKSIHDFWNTNINALSSGHEWYIRKQLVRYLVCTWFLSISPSWSSASPCSWKVIIIKATKIFTKKNGNTTKYTM